MFKNAIIFIPGLNDQKLFNKKLRTFLPKIWKKYPVKLFIFDPFWNRDKTFQPKLQLIMKQIDYLYKNNYKIFLIGQSAGGIAALNAYLQRREKVEKVINICGRLKKGKKVFPTLDIAAFGNSAFKDAVLIFEKHENKLTKKDRKKILTLRPIWDDVVPVQTTKLESVREIVIPIITHKLGGLFSFLFYSDKMMEFLGIIN